MSSPRVGVSASCPVTVLALSRVSMSPQVSRLISFRVLTPVVANVCLGKMSSIHQWLYRTPPCQPFTKQRLLGYIVYKMRKTYTKPTWPAKEYSANIVPVSLTQTGWLSVSRTDIIHYLLEFRQPSVAIAQTVRTHRRANTELRTCEQRL